MEEKHFSLSHPTKSLSGTVQLTGSKSESNRALIIQALSKGNVVIKNLSDAADTVTLGHALDQIDSMSAGQQQEKTIDIGPAGTAMRFLTSYLSRVEGDFILTGSKRMQERPIRILVDALRELGADIAYANQEGFPPITIKGGFEQTKQTISIQGSVSSQYISSLLLIAPALPQGLSLKTVGGLTSKPYVTMTLDMLKEAGIDYIWKDDTIHVAPQPYQSVTLYVEPDWSAASYWYAMVALAAEADIILPGLKPTSLQGDVEIINIMRHFGVESRFEKEGLRLTKTSSESEKNLFDFKTCPDLAQTVVVVAAALRRNVSFTGIETLKIKETDRIAALQKEIGKFGCLLVQDEEETELYHLDTSGYREPEALTIATYEDHRMAMAFAPLALVFDAIQIEEPAVVEKSYPDFWRHLQAQGFKIDDM